MEKLTSTSLAEHIVDESGRIILADLIKGEVPEGMTVYAQSRMTHTINIASIVGEPNIVTLLHQSCGNVSSHPSEGDRLIAGTHDKVGRGSNETGLNDDRWQAWRWTARTGNSLHRDDVVLVGGHVNVLAAKTSCDEHLALEIKF